MDGFTVTGGKMDWEIKWINPQIETTYMALTLVLTNDQLGTYRIDKIFPPSEIGAEQLSAVAAHEISIIESELEPVAPIATSEG